eukprot:2975501-Prymnesium_polylepis.1
MPCSATWYCVVAAVSAARWRRPRRRMDLVPSRRLPIECLCEQGTRAVGTRARALAGRVLAQIYVFHESFFEICRTKEKREIHTKVAAGEKVTQVSCEIFHPHTGSIVLYM